MYAGGNPNFDERTGMRTGGFKPMRPPTKGDIKSLPFRPGLPPAPLPPESFIPGRGRMSPGQLPIPRTQVPTGPIGRTGGSMPVDETVRTMQFIDENNNGVDDRDERPQSGVSDSLFGTQGSGTYDNLMSRAFQEYSSGQSPYEGTADLLRNRPVFDRGARPESSMPSYSYNNSGGSDGFAQLQAQQPGIQAQYDQFAQQIQSAQEAAQQQAQQQTDMAASERQALMDRIAALEGQEGPDLEAFGSQLRQEILGQMPEQQEIDIEALRRQIMGEVESQLQQNLPDVEKIRDDLMAQLSQEEQVEIERLRQMIQESIDAGASPEEISALRSELQQRIQPVEQRLTTIEETGQPNMEEVLRNVGERFNTDDVARQIQELRDRFGQGGGFDIEDMRRQIREAVDAQQPDAGGLEQRLQERFDRRYQAPDFDPEAIQRQVEQIRNRDVVSPDVLDRLRNEIGQERGRDIEAVRNQINPLTERISQLRGRLDERPTIDQDAIARRVRESINIPQIDLGGIREQIANLRGRLDERVPAGTAGIKPLPPTPKSPKKTTPRMGTFPPGSGGGDR